jgi:regulator of protease activity HflC (stomatin/prohibitin superfamily)
MDEQNVLRHLLGVEAEAAALVDEAQAEADRRVAEGEKRCRLRFDEEYGKKTAELDAGYEKAAAAFHQDYRRELDEYRGGFSALSPDQGRFAALVEEYLGAEAPKAEA